MKDLQSPILNEDEHKEGSKTLIFDVEQRIELKQVSFEPDERKKELIRTDLDCLSTDKHDDEFDEKGGDEAPLDDKQKKVVMQALIVYVMPFLGKIAVSLPTVYFTITLSEEFDVPISSIGWFLAAVQIARFFTNLANIASPKASHLIGSIIALAGYALLIIPEIRNSLVPFTICNVVSGFASVGAVVQIYAKQAFSKDVKLLRSSLFAQNTVNVAGGIAGYFISGVIADNFGVLGIAIAGTINMAIMIPATLLYFFLDARNQKDNTTEEDTNISVKGEDTEEMNTDFTNSEIQCIQNQINQAADTGKTPDLLVNEYSDMKSDKINKIVYVVALIAVVDAFTAGVVTAVGPLYFTSLGYSESEIGYILTISTALSFILCAVTSTSKGNALMKRYTPSPYNFFIVLGVLVVSVSAMAIPVALVAAIMFSLVIMSCNLFLGLRSEVQGAITLSSHFVVIGPSVKMIRRGVYVLINLISPMLLAANSMLPFLFSGTSSLFLGMLFVVAIRHQQKENMNKINAVLKKSNRCLNRWSFVSQEVMARSASVALYLDENLKTQIENLKTQIEDSDSYLDENPDEAETTSFWSNFNPELGKAR